MGRIPEGRIGAGSAAPAARVSHAALRANAAPWLDRDATVDLRVDAWGHGASEVAETLLAAGLARVVADAAAHAPLAARFGAARVLESWGAIGVLGRESPAPALGSGPEPEEERGARVDLGVLYGLPGGVGRPVMRLSGAVLSVKDLRAGEGVSYGYTHRAARDTRIALVTGGYAQGIVRALGNAAAVTVAGVRHPIVGRVAMDVCVVDVGDAPVARGDEVVFFGDPDAGEPSLAEWCAATGLSAAELVAAVGLHTVREHVR